MALTDVIKDIKECARREQKTFAEAADSEFRNRQRYEMQQEDTGFTANGYDPITRDVPVACGTFYSNENLMQILDECLNTKIGAHPLLKNVSDKKKAERVAQIHAIVNAATLVLSDRSVNTQEYQGHVNLKDLGTANIFAKQINTIRSSVWCCIFPCSSTGKDLDQLYNSLASALQSSAPGEQAMSELNSSKATVRTPLLNK